MRSTAPILLGFGLASAHICLLHPDQRGGANVTGPGNHVCYNPGPACGDVARFPVGTPYPLDGGSGFDVMLQQALNHYQPGDEGWIDVSYAASATPATDAEFTVIARIPDVYKHMQAAQTNYTVPVAVPDVDVAHGVLMVRYHPNKPTEPLAFRNCADIAIVSAATRRARAVAAAAEAAAAPPPPLLALVEASTPALDASGGTAQSPPPPPQQQLVQVASDGALRVLSTVPSPWRVQGTVVASLPATASTAAQLLFLAAPHRALDAAAADAAAPPPSTLLRFAQGQSGGWTASVDGIDFGSLLSPGERGTVQAFLTPPALQPTTPRPAAPATATAAAATATATAAPDGGGDAVAPLRAVVQVAATDAATGAASFCFMLVDIDAATGAASAPGAGQAPGSPAPRTAPESTFVNFLWASESAEGLVTVLAGDENSLFKLNAVLHSFTFHGTGFPAVVTTAPLDNGAYALQHVHAHPTTRGLMALSPGLFSAAKQPGSAWHLVSVDGATGNVTRVGELVEASGGGSDGGGGGGGGARAEGAPAQFDPDFGGSVVHAFGGSTTTPDGAFTMTHVLRRSKSKAHVVVRVDTACPGGKCSFAASALQTGVNNEYRASMFLQTEAA